MMPLSRVADNSLKASTMFRGLINTLGLVQSAGLGRYPSLGGHSGLGGMSKPWGKVWRAGRGIPLIARLLRDRWGIPELR